MDHDAIARRYAEQVARTLGIDIADKPVYTYEETGQAAAWSILNNAHDARLAVNVEDDDRPYAVIETGSLVDPEYHMRLCQFAGTWVESEPGAAPRLHNPLGADHPILAVRDER